MLLALDIDWSVLATAFVVTLIIVVVLLAVFGAAFFLVKKGLPWRKVALYGSLALFVLGYPLAPRLVHWTADHLYDAPTVAATTTPVASADGGNAPAADALGNMTDSQVEADHVASGAVPLGTVFTKLWITVLFYLLFCSLPWILQRATHPGPTEWAKKEYTSDFNTKLTVPQKFENNGRLQLVQAIKVVGAGILAAYIS